MPASAHPGQESEELTVLPAGRQGSPSGGAQSSGRLGARRAARPLRAKLGWAPGSRRRLRLKVPGLPPQRSARPFQQSHGAARLGPRRF